MMGGFGRDVDFSEQMPLSGATCGSSYVIKVCSNALSSKSEVGKKGENVALEYLKSRGMELLARNWRSGHKELDLVMCDGAFLRIVEVRSLTYPNLQPPEESVDWNKRRKVMSAAKKYASSNFVQNEIVFDIVSVVFNGEDAHVDYIPNAFAPQW